MSLAVHAELFKAISIIGFKSFNFNQIVAI